jgi:hypothetical protein
MTKYTKTKSYHDPKDIVTVQLFNFIYIGNKKEMLTLQHVLKNTSQVVVAGVHGDPHQDKTP